MVRGGDDEELAVDAERGRSTTSAVRATPKFIAVAADGVTEVHAAGDGVYATLCGIDGDDREQSIVGLPDDPRIDCPQCRAKWQAWRRFVALDFT